MTLGMPECQSKVDTIHSYPRSHPTYLPRSKPTMCSNLILIFSISFNLFEIVLLGNNASTFGLDSSGSSILLRDVIGNFITFGYLDFIFISFFFILIVFRFFDIFLVITLWFRLYLPSFGTRSWWEMLGSEKIIGVSEWTYEQRP